MTDHLSGALIAAGRGERLRPATEGIPKPLVVIGGKSLLRRQVDLMLEAGARRVYVIINTETAKLMKQGQMELPASVELTVADTANSMESLLTLGERIQPGRFALATVDALVEPAEFAQFVARAQIATANPWCCGALGVVEWRGDLRPLFVEVGPDATIRRVGEAPSAIVTAGVYFFSTRIFQYAAAARELRLNALRRFLGLLIDKGEHLAAIELRSALDIDEPADLEEARARFDARRRASGVLE